VRLGIVVHADRTEPRVCAVLELGNPLVFAVRGSGQLHYNNGKSILAIVVIG
jgi:hypothetical protein